MAEYVTKEQVKEEILSWARCINNPERLVTEDALYVIDALPAADVRPVVRGRWIVKETAYEDTEAKCSECGFTTLINEPGNGLHMLSDLNYCPGCGSYNGADMREVGEDD